MVRVFYTQKTEQLLKKMELKHWRELSKERDLKDLKDLTPEAIKFSYDFSVAMQEHDNQKAFEIITKIEQLDTIWRAE